VLLEAVPTVGLSPPSGDMFGQNTVWLTCPARLNARFFSQRFTVVPMVPASRASARASTALFAPVT